MWQSKILYNVFIHEKHKKLWIKFCDTPIQYSRTGCTTEEFNNFPIGTFRADIVDWFYKTFEVELML